MMKRDFILMGSISGRVVSSEPNFKEIAKIFKKFDEEVLESNEKSTIIAMDSYPYSDEIRITHEDLPD